MEMHFHLSPAILASYMQHRQFIRQVSPEDSNAASLTSTSSANSLQTNNSPRALDQTVLQWRAEAVGCPGPTRFLDALENILCSYRKISDDLF